MATVDTPTAQAVLSRLTEPSDLLDHLVIQIPRDTELSLRADPSPDVVRDIVNAGGKRAKSLLSQLQDTELVNAIAQSEHRLGMLRAVAVRDDLTDESRERLFEIGVKKEWDLLHKDLLDRMTPVERLPKLLELIERGVPPRGWQDAIISLHRSVLECREPLDNLIQRYLQLPTIVLAAIAESAMSRHVDASVSSLKALLEAVEPKLPVTYQWRDDYPYRTIRCVDLNSLRETILLKVMDTGDRSEFVELANRYPDAAAQALWSHWRDSSSEEQDEFIIDAFEAVDTLTAVSMFSDFVCGGAVSSQGFAKFTYQVRLTQRYLSAWDDLAGSEADPEILHPRHYYAESMSTCSDEMLELLTAAKHRPIAKRARQTLRNRIPPLREQLGPEGFREWLKSAETDEAAQHQLSVDEWLFLARTNPDLTPRELVRRVSWDRVSQRDKRWLIEEFLDDDSLRVLLRDRYNYNPLDNLDSLDRSDFNVLLATLRVSDADSYLRTKTRLADGLFSGGFLLAGNSRLQAEDLSDEDLVVLLSTGSVTGSAYTSLRFWLGQNLADGSQEVVERGVRLIETLREQHPDHPVVVTAAAVAAEQLTVTTEAWKRSSLGRLLTGVPLATLTRGSGSQADPVYDWVVPQMQDRFGTCVDRWDVALDLLPEWQATLDELFEVVDNVI